MEWVFPILFILAFLWTKKDLALVCGSVSMISALTYNFADPEVWTLEQILIVNITLNLVLASLSEIHWLNNRKPLARCMVWIASLAILVNTVQVFKIYDWTEYALLSLQAAALLAIVRLDGRKEYMHDVAASVFGIIGSLGSSNSNNKSHEG